VVAPKIADPALDIPQPLGPAQGSDQGTTGLRVRGRCRLCLGLGLLEPLGLGP